MSDSFMASFSLSGWNNSYVATKVGEGPGLAQQWGMCPSPPSAQPKTTHSHAAK